MGRKIIQIATMPDGPEGSAGPGTTASLFGLCDDGSVWELVLYDEVRTWRRVEDIPQVEGAANGQ